MSTIGRIASSIFAYRFLRLLTKPWDETEAYRLGIVDENGKTLKRVRDLRTPEERDAFSVFNRLVFNVKRIFERIPLGKRRIGSYAAALYLIKESADIDEKTLLSGVAALYLIKESTDIDEKTLLSAIEDFTDDIYLLGLQESTELDLSENIEYTTNEEVLYYDSDSFAPAGTKIVVLEKIGSLASVPIYEAVERKTGRKLLVTKSNISLH